MLQELKGKPEGENLSDAEAFAVEISDLKKIDSRLEVRNNKSSMIALISYLGI